MFIHSPGYCVQYGDSADNDTITVVAADVLVTTQMISINWPGDNVTSCCVQYVDSGDNDMQ